MTHKRYRAVCTVFLLIGFVAAASPVFAQAPAQGPVPPVPPQAKEKRPSGPKPPAPERPAPDSGSPNGGPDFRSIEGNAEIPLARIVPSDYADGVSTPSGVDRPNPRTISNVVMAEPSAIPNQRGASSFLWQWGQFVDHDIDLTHTTSDELLPIPIPAGDPDFDPGATGEVVLLMLRSIYDPSSGTDSSNPRQQLNGITSFIDASNVYGSDAERAAALRTNDGTGRLKTSAGGLLPFNTEGLDNAGGPSSELFVAGDERSNEQVGLTALHVLFVREHNRLADAIRGDNPGFSGEQVYQHARRMVGAEMQAITYREFLPALLGRDAIAPYQGFQPNADPSIANLFSTAAYRLGHSMLNENLLRSRSDGQTIASGDLSLAESFFFSPERLRTEGGIEPILRGLAWQKARRIDPYLTGAVRNFLFGAPGQGGFDLASLNIQRGRDHGLPDYNTARQALGLGPKTSFAAISGDPNIQRRLETAYGSVDRIDPWVGGLAEDPHRDALVGEFFYAVVADQFRRLRDGDPHWYERALGPSLAREVEQLKLGDIIRLNTTIDSEITRDVFQAPRDAPY